MKKKKKKIFLKKRFKIIFIESLIQKMILKNVSKYI